MLRPMLACCKLYVSEGRSAAALRAVEQAARRHHPAVVLVNTFIDDAYNRVGYTLVSRLTQDASPSPLRRTVFGVVGAALEAIDLGSHAGAHPRLGAVDHVCFHPLAGASLRNVAALAADVAADIGDELQGNRIHPTVSCSFYPSLRFRAAANPGRTLTWLRHWLVGSADVPVRRGAP
jgi:glutamate formiminotransferase